MGSFWWCDILKLLSQFKSIVVISIRDGATSILWHDHWGGNILSQHFPELYSFSYAAISIPLPKNLFHLPLTTEAYNQFLELVSIFWNF